MLSHWREKTTLLNRLSLCHLCGLNIENRLVTDMWCQHCYQYFQSQPRCLRCGIPTLTTVDQCGNCLSNPPLWHRLYCVNDYTFPTSGYVHQFKYQKKFWFAKNLARLLANNIDQPAPIITGVPLHWQRYIRRGFNQSELLAHYLAKQSPNSIHLKQAFIRTRSTPAQQGLSKEQRQVNLHQAFQLSRIPKASHVAIVDDVVTTGCTVRHLCKLLLEVGVERIDIYCVCRTPEPAS